MPACPPPPRRFQEVGLMMAQNQQPNRQRSMPYFPDINSLPRSVRPNGNAMQHHNQQQQRKRGFIEPRRKIQPRPTLRSENIEEWQHFYPIAKNNAMANDDSDRRQESATVATSRAVTPFNSASDVTAMNTAMMGVSLEKSASYPTSRDSDDDCGGSASGGMTQATKRRRRSTLIDEYTVVSRRIGGDVEMNRSSFSRAA